jgi:hypothetical protein
VKILREGLATDLHRMGYARRRTCTAASPTHTIITTRTGSADRV